MYSAIRSADVNRSQPRAHRPAGSRGRAAAALIGTAALLTGCSSAVTLDPAPDAANPDCAPAMVALPETLAGMDQRETTAQATSAWGDPASVILKCGVQVSEPVSDPCVSVNDVDWILRPAEGRPDEAAAEASEQASASPSDAGGSPSAEGSAEDGERSAAPAGVGGTWIATSYGRSPAIQVTFDADQVSSSSLLVDLGSAVSQLPQQRQCTTVQDTLEDLPRQ